MPLVPVPRSRPPHGMCWDASLKTIAAEPFSRVRSRAMAGRPGRSSTGYRGPHRSTGESPDRVCQLTLSMESGDARRSSGETDLAASPRISKSLANASATISSRSRSSRLRPSRNAIAFREASSMCRRRTSSLGAGILDDRVLKNALAEVPAQ